MTTPPLTRPSLLVRIRDAGDREAWRQFVDVYAPLVYKFARRRGLQDADAADLTQDVLQAVAGASKRLVYDPERGTFRAWLYTVARNKLRNFLLARQRRRDDGDPGLLDEQLAREEEELWEREYEQRLFDWATEQVRGHFQESTWRAFWMTAVENRGAADVAAELGLSVGAVYIAKSRVLARLREEIQRIHSV
ncbi:MAG TPA: sigma-70 family RNA polymerase sigma factor [Gemmataceae bacterium]|nr:sigma-70 family RNA polymerase sigma factor [Gemmataceae bacterium]